MEVLTLLAKVGAFMFALLILFPIVVGPLMYIGMALVAMFAGAKPEDSHPQGTEWKSAPAAK